MENLTGDVILEQLRKDYSRWTIAAGIFFVLATAGFTVSLIFLGLLHPVTIASAALLLILLILLITALYKCIFIEKTPVIQLFGDAIALAGCIRAGSTFAIWKTPPSRKYQLLITEEYIVCPTKVQSYIPLSDITSVQRVKMSKAGFLRRLLGARSLSAAVASIVPRKERAFRKRNPLPDSEQFDMLCLWDLKKKKKHYVLSLADFNTVMAFLREYLPEAEFKADRKV